MQRALEFLREHNEIAFATSEGNLPRLRIFQIMKQDGTTLYFATSPKKAVWHELQANPNVELLAYADNISVRCSGKVNFDVADDVKCWIYDNNPVLPRLYAIVGELREARLAVDGAYEKLIAYLNALLLVSPSEELLQLEKVLNSDIRLLEAQLAASRKKNGGEDVEPEAVDAGEVE